MSGIEWLTARIGGRTAGIGPVRSNIFSFHLWRSVSRQSSVPQAASSSRLFALLEARRSDTGGFTRSDVRVLEAGLAPIAAAVVAGSLPFNTAFAGPKKPLVIRG